MEWLEGGNQLHLFTVSLLNMKLWFDLLLYCFSAFYCRMHYLYSASSVKKEKSTQGVWSWCRELSFQIHWSATVKGCRKHANSKLAAAELTGWIWWIRDVNLWLGTFPGKSQMKSSDQNFTWFTCCSRCHRIFLRAVSAKKRKPFVYCKLWSARQTVQQFNARYFSKSLLPFIMDITFGRSWW